MVKLSLENEQAFLQSSTNKERIAYISDCWVYAPCEHWIIQNTPDKVIKSLVKKWPLSPKGEVLLIEKGNPLLIKTYIKSMSLGEGAQKALIKRGNHSEIMLYISLHHNLFPGAVEDLRARNNKQELDAYNDMAQI